jgi:hypothetical protein
MWELSFIPKGMPVTSSAAKWPPNAATCGIPRSYCSTTAARGRLKLISADPDCPMALEYVSCGRQGCSSRHLQNPQASAGTPDSWPNPHFPPFGKGNHFRPWPHVNAFTRRSAMDQKSYSSEGTKLFTPTVGHTRAEFCIPPHAHELLIQNPHIKSGPNYHYMKHTFCGKTGWMPR